MDGRCKGEVHFCTKSKPNEITRICPQWMVVTTTTLLVLPGLILIRIMAASFFTKLSNDVLKATEQVANRMEEGLALVMSGGRPQHDNAGTPSADRSGYVPFGNEDSGRNLPHGLIVDNIGLNGLLILEKQTERNFFVTAAKWSPDQDRLFHLQTSAEGAQSTRPVLLRIRRTGEVAEK